MTTNNLEEKRRRQLILVLSGAAFLIFFQAFMVAPLIPRLANIFEVPVETIGLIVPVYLIPYGVATLIYGPLSDRFGRLIIIFMSLAFTIDFPVLVAILLVTTVSLGYDLTQPLFAGIVTNLSSNRGIAMGLNVFLLFTEFGFGSLIWYT